MDSEQLQRNLIFARKTGLYPFDLWGAEWWYWRKLQGDDKLWAVVYEQISKFAVLI
jgi:hypothetical protein